MADLTQIELPDGNTYNIKDTTKTASTGTTQDKWYKIAEGTFPDNGERLDLLFAVSSGTDNVYSGIYNFTVETVDNARDINLLVYVRNQMVYTYDTTAVSDANTWAIYQFLRTGYTRSITWTIISENINTSANPPYILYNNPTSEASIPASYSYQTTPGIGGEIGGVYQQNTTDNIDMPVLLGSDSNYVYKNGNFVFNPTLRTLYLTAGSGLVPLGGVVIDNEATSMLTNISCGGVQLSDRNGNLSIALNASNGSISATSLNGATIGNPPRWEGTQAQYDALATYDPNTIYYITDGIPGDVRAINDLSDVSISSPQNGQSLIYDSSAQMWTNVSTSTGCTISAGPNMPSGFPVPNITRRGNIVQIVFGIQLPAGDYSNYDILWKVNPVPVIVTRETVALGGGFPTININTDGDVKFNGAQRLESKTWIIGQIVYVTDGVYA